jgi:hypothetical protein
MQVNYLLLFKGIRASHSHHKSYQEETSIISFCHNLSHPMHLVKREKDKTDRILSDRKKMTREKERVKEEGKWKRKRLSSSFTSRPELNVRIKKERKEIKDRTERREKTEETFFMLLWSHKRDREEGSEILVLFCHTQEDHISLVRKRKTRHMFIHETKEETHKSS